MPGLKPFPKKKKVAKPFPKLKKFQAFGKVSPSGLNKFAKLGKPVKTLKQAKRKLFGELDSTISATGFIKRNGKVIKLKNLPKAFRPSRNPKTPNRIVERKNQRLSSKLERKTIQQARRNKPFKKRL